MSGVKLAVLYGLMPHQLGLCGSELDLTQKILRKYLNGQTDEMKARAALKNFRGAYPYYKLIARVNKIEDVLDKRVVEAYWLGNELLEEITITDLRRMIIKDFSGAGLLSNSAAEKKAAAIPRDSKAHHAFHVLRIGSVTGSIDFTGQTKLKDSCRIGWGKVANGKRLMASGKNQKIKVIYQPLVGKNEIKLGRPVAKKIIWDKKIIPNLKKGDWVSFHWGMAVQILTPNNVKKLEKYTQITLDA